jgi:enoyl-CoA hydratase/carnithine racemase
MSTVLETTREGRVIHLTLNRPEKRNALDASLCRELVEALQHAEGDESVGAILLTGAGKSFCAGMDLTEVMERPDPEMDALHERLFSVGARLTTPIVAAVHGAALAGGTGLVANCHVVVATPDAEFGLTEINLGLWPFLIFRACAQAMGERRAVQLALTGGRFKADKAQEFGLVHQVAEDALDCAASAARQIAGRNPMAIRKGMQFVQQSSGKDWHQAAELARAARREVFDSPGFQEGLRAFQAKRKGNAES